VKIEKRAKCSSAKAVHALMLAMVQTHDYMYERTIAYHQEKIAQNHDVTPLRRADV
jgi:hypothetical protein